MESRKSTSFAWRYGFPPCCGRSSVHVFCVSSSTNDTNCTSGFSAASREGSGWLTAAPESTVLPPSEVKRLVLKMKLRMEQNIPLCPYECHRIGSHRLHADRGGPRCLGSRHRATIS